MKKKTVKDEDGYLGVFIPPSHQLILLIADIVLAVTKEEQAWESFSEDEPAPKKLKGLPTANTNKPAVAAAVAVKKAGKPGQGNIMSFFAKK